jgi:hypothetical protein
MKQSPGFSSKLDCASKLTILCDVNLPEGSGNAAPGSLRRQGGTPYLRRQAVPACFREAPRQEGKAGRLTYVGKPGRLAYAALLSVLAREVMID